MSLIDAIIIKWGKHEYELKQLDYKKFKDKDLTDRFGFIGKSIDILFEYGIYEGDYFIHWIERLFQAKDKTKFRDIRIPGEEDERYKYKLNVIASDLTDKNADITTGFKRF